MNTTIKICRKETMKNSLIILVLLAILSTGCKSHKYQQSENPLNDISLRENPLKTYPNSPITEILDGKNETVTSALPEFCYWTYDKDKDRLNLRVAKNFVFYNDSVFACGFFDKDSIPEYVQPENLYTITGTYKQLNDSIIEVVYKDDNNPFVIHVDHSDEMPDSIKVRIEDTKRIFSVHEHARYIKWTWLNNDNIIMTEQWGFPQDSEYALRWLLGTNYEVEFAEKVVDKYPDEILFTWAHQVWGLGPIPISNQLFIRRAEFKLDLADPGHNFLPIVDDRTTANSGKPINRIFFETIYPNNRWYPDKLRFKKKDDKLILLNNDGSESDISLKLLDNTVVY